MNKLLAEISEYTIFTSIPVETTHKEIFGNTTLASLGIDDKGLIVKHSDCEYMIFDNFFIFLIIPIH